MEQISNLDGLLLKQYNKILESSQKIELNMNEFKIYTELCERKKNLEEVKIYIKENIINERIKHSLLAREALKIAGCDSILLKEIDNIFCEFIKKNDMIVLLDFMGEQFEDVRIDLCVSFLRLLIFLKKKLEWVDGCLDNGARLLCKEIKTHWRTVSGHQEMIDLDEVKKFSDFFLK